MRLAKVAHGHPLRSRIMMGAMQLIARARTPDVIRMLLYRPDFFGRPYSAWLHEVMRGPSAWSVGERELFAAFTSRQNQCQFCVVGHSAASSQALGDSSLVAAALHDWRRAPVNARVRATLGLLQKLTREPGAVSSGDIEAVRAAGVSDAALEEAIQICALFNIINRLADAFDFDTSMSHRPAVVARGAKALLRFGYRI